MHIVGARPNFMKAAPVCSAMGELGIERVLIHTGQHYDDNMSRIFFDELGLPKPDMNLGVGSGSHARQTAEVMIGLEPVMLEQKPDVLVVYGDVNSTVAAALVAAKLKMPVAHVEAGLRSFDLSMPEEINRMITDRISDLLFTPSPDGDENLLKEGVAPEKIHCVGNVMIDTLARLLPMSESRGVLRGLGLEDSSGKVEPYATVTLHRPSNVDEPERLTTILRALGRLAERMHVVFPAHPRTRERMNKLSEGLVESSGIRMTEPVGYLDFLRMQRMAKAVITDSGGIQEETTWLGVPCFTLRPNTERPITITEGTNRLIDRDVDKLDEIVASNLDKGVDRKSPPKLWDGKAGARIAAIIKSAVP